MEKGVCKYIFMRKAKALILVFLSLLVFWTSNVRAEQRKYWPDKTRWRKAFMNAIRSPGTWVPAAGAILVGTNGYDSKISDWAVENTPLFGSPEDAQKASDDLRAATHIGMLITALFVPDKEHPVCARIERLLIQHTAAVITTSATSLIKTAAGRTRPDQSDDESFPSGHTSRSFANAAMASRNIDFLQLPRPARICFKTCMTTLAAATSWARIEGGKHYPSDAFAGASLGNFVAIFLNDAFLGTNQTVSIYLNLQPNEKQIWISLRF